MIDKPTIKVDKPTIKVDQHRSLNNCQKKQTNNQQEIEDTKHITGCLGPRRQEKNRKEELQMGMKEFWGVMSMFIILIVLMMDGFTSTYK